MNFLSLILCVVCVVRFSDGEIGGKSYPNEQEELEVRSRFDKFMKTHNVSYGSEVEQERRFRIFRANLKKIDILNANEQGTAVYGVTRFADLSTSEFKKYYLGLRYDPKRIANSTLRSHKMQDEVGLADLPRDFDWRNHGAVTPVKNQGMCGSCWAFSVTGNVEGQYAVKHGELLSFSEQELVDCDKKDAGCNGGYMTDGYEYIEKAGGLETESDYPYEGQDDSCKFSKSKIAAVVSDYVNITSNETVMAQWLYKNGPISIALNAFAMQFYFGGVSHPLKIFCNPNDLDHGVLLVGFGYQKTRFTRKILPYWLIKNSWGSFWGEKGYYKLYRGSGACGVDKMPTSAIIQ